MKKEPIIDESILDGIPEELIRPLLAISIRATLLHTVEDFERLLRDVQKIREHDSRLSPNSLYYVDIENSANRRLYAAKAAEDWVKQEDPSATFWGIEISRWTVFVRSGEDDKRLFVSYKPVGLDMDTMEEAIELVVTEASPDEL